MTNTDDIRATLAPVITRTVETRQHPASSEPDQLVWCERNYRLEESDEVWFGLSGLTVQRGCRYSGMEETLRINNYSAELFGEAVLRLVAELQRDARPDGCASDFCRARAVAFLAKLRAAVAAPVSLPGEG